MKIELKRLRHFVFFLLLFTGLSFESFSQSTGAVTGTVKDPDGSPLSNVTVIAVNESDSTQQNSAVTNDVGVFRFELVADAKYRFVVSYVGF
ncbi:MAG: carboxypeptidase-like regulatory domain-containing protein, partial [Flavitalea sp.]